MSRLPRRKLIVTTLGAAVIGLATVPALADVTIPGVPGLGTPSPGATTPPLIPPVTVPVPGVSLPPVPVPVPVPTLKLPVPVPTLKVPVPGPSTAAPAPKAPAGGGGVGPLGGLPFGHFTDHVPAVPLQHYTPPVLGPQALGPDMPYDQTGHNTTAAGVDVAVATRAFITAQAARSAHRSGSSTPGLLALVLAAGAGTAVAVSYRRRTASAVANGSGLDIGAV